MGGACGTYGGREKRVEVFGGHIEGNSTRKTSRGRRIILKCVLQKLSRRACTGLFWLKIRIHGRLL